MGQLIKNDRSIILLLLIAVLLSRVVFYGLGIRFDAEEITTLWQIIDVELLKRDLLGSLFYLHFQPPLFNAFLGIVLKLSPENPQTLLGIIYLLFGLAMSFFMYKTMRVLGAAPLLSGLATFGFMISPPTILYENWIFYTYPVALLFLLLNYYFYKYANKFCIKTLIILITVATLLALTRSVFHLFWLVICIGFIFATTSQRHLLHAVITVSLFLIIVVGWYAKNAWLYGQFTAFSATGMSLAKMVQPVASQDLVDKLIQQGRVSQVYLVPRYSPIEKYPTEFQLKSPYEHPLLKNTRKSTGGLNFNHYAYVNISKQYQSDVLEIIKNDNKIILKIIIRSLGMFFLPASDYPPFLEPNYSRISTYDRWWSYVFQLRFAYYTREQLKNESISTLKKITNISLIVLLLYLLVPTLLAIKSIKSTIKNIKITFLFYFINVIIISTICILFETGENNRFRFEMDPTVWAFAVGLVGSWLSNRANATTQPHQTVANNLSMSSNPWSES